MASLVETIMSLEGLPSPPKTLLSVLAMLSDESAGLAEIGRLVVQNQGLTLLILRTANSSMYLGNVPVTGVREATARLGTSGMRRIVTAHLGGQLMSKAGQGYGLQSDEAQRGALAGALAAQLIAEERGLDQDLAFTAGLLRDCGKLALDHLIGVDRLREDMLTHTDGSQLEHEHLSYGFDHAEVGAALAMTWGLPDDIVRCIAHHHCPEPGVDDP
ncbi:MAG: HDOD domain-containing protein, partial [Planctomycetota bacterium]|nr:HDOD domain-containing protein [Planctomycetota bacterium]